MGGLLTRKSATGYLRRAANWAERRRQTAPTPNAPISDVRFRAIDIVKTYHTTVGARRVLDGVSFDLRQGEKIGVLGRNGAGKSTLMKLIGGVELPTSGRIESDFFMSWPMGFSGGLEGHMSGMANIRFISKMYNKSVDEVSAFVDDFAELGRQLFIPVIQYSSGMKMRLAFALTLAIDFDCLLIDEVIAVGDQRFHKKCRDALFVHRADRSMILISHDVGVIREFCGKALVLKNGRARVFDDIGLGLKIYETL